MAQLKFFRGSKASLPQEIHDGAIYIINTNESAGTGLIKGEMYVDSGSSRLRVDSPQVYSYTQEQINTLTNVTSTLGAIYIIKDAQDNQIGFKVGDGLAYIVDLPTVDFSAIQNIQRHVSASASNSLVSSDEITGSNEVRLILSASTTYN